MHQRGQGEVEEGQRGGNVLCPQGSNKGGGRVLPRVVDGDERRETPLPVCQHPLQSCAHHLSCVFFGGGEEHWRAG